RDLHVDVLAARQAHAARAALGGLGERDGQRHRDVAARRRADIVEADMRLESGAAAACGPAEHALENFLETTEAHTAAGGAPEAAARKHRLEILGTEAAARLRPEALEAVEAGLALRVDLAAVERLALGFVAENLIGGVELAEALRGLRVALVGVRMQLL